MLETLFNGFPTSLQNPLCTGATIMDADSAKLENIEICTPDEMLVEGLKVLAWLGWNQHDIKIIHQNKKGPVPWPSWFQSSRGCSNVGRFTNNNSRSGKGWSLKTQLAALFWGMHFLRKHPKSSIKAEQIWKVSENTHIDCSWCHMEKLRALKAAKLCWPSDNFGDDIWICLLYTSDAADE